MRRTYGFLFLALTGLGGAIAIPNQEAPLAEQHYKNIISFKGTKADDLIPAMQFMNASLKVDCDYCHTADRSSDDLEPKRAAREMIALQRDINKRNFNGRNQVTCATCHAGHIRPVNVPPVEGLEARARRNNQLKPDDILAAYGKAAGGDAAHPLAGLRVEGTSTTNGVKSKFEAVYQADKFAYVIHEGKKDNKTGFDGTAAYFTTEKGIAAVPLAYAAKYVNQKSLFTGPSSLPKLSNPMAATAKIGGKDQLVVMGTTVDRVRITLYFDKVTGLLTRSMYNYPTVLGSMAQTNDFSDYKKVNGVQIASKIVNHNTEGDSTLEFRSIKVDPKITEKAFDIPN